jgi:hypothetical protein
MRSPDATTLQNGGRHTADRGSEGNKGRPRSARHQGGESGAEQNQRKSRETSSPDQQRDDCAHAEVVDAFYNLETAA